MLSEPAPDLIPGRKRVISGQKPKRRPKPPFFFPGNRPALSYQIDHGLEEGVSGFDGFGVCLVVGLVGDQVDHLLGEVHV